MREIELFQGDCLHVMRTLPDACVHAIVTDPPYGLSFMGRAWDYDVPTTETWQECLRVLKPGGHLLAFAGTRTQHRMAVRIEDAGFEIRDMLAWVHGMGFPKGIDVSKAMDKAAGAQRQVIGTRVGQPGYSLQANDTTAHARTAYGKYTDAQAECAITAPATPAAAQWHGWNTALKPALEPITLARKPLTGTVAENVRDHGTGALHIDACRVGTRTANESGWATSGSKASANRAMTGANYDRAPKAEAGTGRWPANLLTDGSDEANTPFGDSARFFYSAKASKADREEGGIANPHCTVKPTDLMRYLCRLITPPGGTVLDPFMGSGTTGKAACLEGFRFIGIELDAEHHATAQRRIEHAMTTMPTARSSGDDWW